jgi:hypothetical protein
MTTSITRQDPAPDALNISGTPHVRFSLISDDPLAPVALTAVSVYFGDTLVVDLGVVVEPNEVIINANAQLGFDFAMRRPLPDDSWVPIKVTAGGLEFNWKFRTADGFGPRAVSVVPAEYSDGAVVSPVISFTLIDDTVGRNTILRVLEDSATDGERTGSVLHSDSLNFDGREGRTIELNGTPDEIFSVLGPHDCTTLGSGALAGATVDIFQDRGLDVYVDGEQVVRSGELTPTANWTPVVTDNTTSIDVTLTRIGPAYTAGKRVPIQVVAPNDDPLVANVSVLNWFFDVGDTRAPTFEAFNPAPATRGLGLNDNLYFEIKDSDSGVDDGTLEVEVNGVTAITAGGGVGDFGGSTVIANGTGWDVTIIKGTPWVDGDHVFVEVNVDDFTGNSARTVFSAHFGAGDDTLGMSTGDGNLAEDDIRRIVAFDLSRTSFARPDELNHTGYAYDGHLYENGYPVDDSPASGPAVSNLASWFTEGASATRGSIAEFPISGYVVATPTYWAILDGNARMWMMCEALSSINPDRWSMAGNTLTDIADVDFGEDGTLFVAGQAIVVVDFVNDKALRYWTTGRSESTGTISDRALEQSGNTLDSSYALAGNNYDLVAGDAWQRGLDRSHAFVACSFGIAQFVGELSDEFIASEGVDPLTLQKVSDFSISGASWLRAEMFADRKAAALCYNVSSQVRMTTYDWLGSLTGGQALRSYHATSSPALPVGVGYDMDMVVSPDKQIISVLTAAALVIIDTVAFQDVQRSDVDLGLNIAGTNPRMTSVAMEPGFEFGLGHLYASAINDDPLGKVVRYREQPATMSTTGQVTQVSTDEYVSIAAMGGSRLRADQVIRASMNIASEDVHSIRASLEVGA